MSWSQFFKMHWEVLAAMDFFTVEVATWHGLVTGRGCSSGSFPSTWNAAPDVPWVPCGSSPLSPTDPSFAAS